MLSKEISILDKSEFDPKKSRFLTRTLLIYRVKSIALIGRNHVSCLDAFCPYPVRLGILPALWRQWVDSRY